MLKKIFVLSSSAMVVFLFTMQMGMSSCTKTMTIIDTICKNSNDTVVQIVTDTLYEQDTVLTTSILTANSWKPQIIKATVGDQFIYYVRGGSDNNASFDNEFITFNADGTGTYTDNAGIVTSLTWYFTDPSNTTLIWVWNVHPSPITITWEDLYYEDGAIRYTEIYVQNNTQVLTSGIRIPK